MSGGVQQFGSVSVYLGEKSGKYPDGNQVVVMGSELSVAFDTPLVTRSLQGAIQDVQAVILGHVHEDHMAGLKRFSQLPLWVHEGDLDAAQSWEGMARHFGYAPAVLSVWHQRMQEDFDYQPRPDAQAYGHHHVWELGGGVRVRAHHLPGHTSGHCALVVESDGVAFIGDIALQSEVVRTRVQLCNFRIEVDADYGSPSRQEGGKVEIYKIDLKAVLEGRDGTVFYLRRSDVVNVPEIGRAHV